MQLGQTIINTPKDDPTRFDPEWRHLVAMAWHSNPKAQWSSEYLDYRKDHWIQTQKCLLDLTAKASREHRDSVIPKDMLAFRQALKWYKGRELSATRYRIEPMLLTPIGFDTIATDIGGGAIEEIVFRTYERLFFNIRGSDDKLNRSCQVRTYFAQPDGTALGGSPPQEKLWRVAGAQLGYGGLMGLWMWQGSGTKEESDIGYISQDSWRLAQSALLERGLRGTMSDFDFINQVGKMVESGRLVKDAVPANSETSELKSLLFGILHGSRPSMKAISTDVDKMQAKTEEIAARISSQKLATGIGQRENIIATGPDKLDSIIKNRLRK